MDDVHRPETDAALLARHAVVDAGERAALLERLRVQGTTVVLHAGLETVAARLVAHRPDRVVFEPESAVAALDALRRAGRAIGVARPEGVKLQFALAALTVDDGPGGVLRARLEGPLARLQRRDAYRIAPPSDGAVRLRLDTRRDGGLPVEVLDLSATGVSFAAAGTAFVAGETIGGCRLELPARAPVDCALRVRTVESGIPGPGMARVGCEFAALDPAAARAVQVWINDAQTRLRRRRPLLR